MTPLVIARVAHEVLRSYCEVIGDKSMVPWDQAQNHQKESTLYGV